MAKEVEMKDSAEPAKAEAPAKAGNASAAPPPPPPSVLEQLAANVKLIEKAVRQKDTRVLFSKVLRQTQAVRRQLTAHDLGAFVRLVLPTSAPSLALLLDALKAVRSPRVWCHGCSATAARLPTPAAAAGHGMPAQAAETEMETDGAANAAPAPEPATADPLPEVEIYSYLLVITFLVDGKQAAAARSLASAAAARLAAFNRRTLDVLAARIYFYLSWAAEGCGALAEVRSALLALHRTAVLRHDDVGQETLLNLLLRNYLHYNLYDQAEALRAKAQREQYRSLQQHCRLLYYLGRIRAVQLEYTDAKDALAQAVRKAPASARGFRACATKWLVLVRLLLGEVPERAELAAPELRSQLASYFELAQAVRSGDLAAFGAVALRHDATFSADGTRHLVVRLRANVIRAGLRRINLAYARISLADVAAKLGLPTVEDAESIVAKAIRDGSVAATLDHDAGVMVAAGVADVYATDEPQAAFHARIAFCMDVHNEALRAMRYDAAGAAQREWDDANALRERQEQELQAALEDDEMEF